MAKIQNLQGKEIPMVGSIPPLAPYSVTSVPSAVLSLPNVQKLLRNGLIQQVSDSTPVCKPVKTGDDDFSDAQ